MKSLLITSLLIVGSFQANAMTMDEFISKCYYTDSMFRVNGYMFDSVLEAYMDHRITQAEFNNLEVKIEKSETCEEVLPTLRELYRATVWRGIKRKF